MNRYYVYLETNQQFKYFFERVKSKYCWGHNDIQQINRRFVVIENEKFWLISVGPPIHYLSFDEWKLLWDTSNGT